MSDSESTAPPALATRGRRANTLADEVSLNGELEALESSQGAVLSSDWGSTLLEGLASAKKEGSLGREETLADEVPLNDELLALELCQGEV